MAEQKVGEVVSRDIGMTAKILQLVNSAFFGLRRHVASAGQAVSLLGLDITKALILSVHIFSQFEKSKIAGLPLETLWRHSMAVGAYARRICIEENTGPKMADEALMAGVLHDIGILILAANVPEMYHEVLLRVQPNISLTQVEEEILATSHGEVGAYLLGLWGLPDPIVEALAFHHHPRKCLSQHFGPLTAVCTANLFETENRFTASDYSQENREVTAYLKELSLDHRMDAWQEKCRTLSREIKET